QKSYDVDDLNHRVDRRSSGILVRIADGITCDRSFVSIAPFLMNDALVIGNSIFKGFLGVVPCAAAACHSNSLEESGQDTSDKNSTESFLAKQKTYSDRNNNRNKCRHHHLFYCAFCNDVNAFSIFRLCL